MDKNNNRLKGQGAIRSKVLEQGLCTGCCACVNLCPAMEYHKDRTILVHDCDLEKGRCYTYCPRAPTDLNALRQTLFKPEDMTWEMGALKGFYMTRATDETIRAGAQHGGTITALIQLALSQGMIDQAILADQNDQFLPAAQSVADTDAVFDKAGSKFVVSPTVSAFNGICKTDAGKVGVVATPCQALALAKMKVFPVADDRMRMGNLKLVLGLFCGWALDWRKLKNLLTEKVGKETVLGIDIPPRNHACMAVRTMDGTMEIPIAAVNTCVRDNCRYCFDMTCEFADISVGAARSPEGWDVDKGWNHVVVRTPLGETLLDLAREKGVLEFKAVPEKNIEKLKTASARKKQACLVNLAEKTGRQDDLVYLDPQDPMVRYIRDLNQAQSTEGQHNGKW